jgi:phenylalanyl-tRNA synthetase alpha subunit
LGGYLVASGEQGFIELMIRENLVGKYFTITPCFREEKYDELHLPYFMKLELIDTEVDNKKLPAMINDAKRFFDNYLETKVIPTKDGYDIVSAKSNIELGSYGIRAYKEFLWVYGTGVAEPRLSQVLEMK